MKWNTNCSMTSKERIIAALNGQSLDRFPISPRCWRYAQWKNISQLEFARKYGFDLIHYANHDILHTPFRDPYCKEVGPMLKGVEIEIDQERKEEIVYARRKFHTPGGVLKDFIVQPDSGDVYGIGAVQEWKEPIIKKVEDIDLLPYLLPDPCNVEKYMAPKKRLEQEIGEDGLVCFRPAHGVDEVVVDALGVEQALIWSLTEKEAFNKLIRIVDEWYTGIIKHLLESGWRYIFDAWFNFSVSVGWSPKFYIDTVIPMVRAHADLVHSYGGKLFFYDDGKMKDVMGAVVNAGVDFIQTITPPPSGDIEYDWLADNYGGKTCFNGGMDTVKLRFGEAGEIRKDVQEVLDILGPTKKFVLGTSDSITEHTSEQNLNAFFATATERGTEIAQKTF